MEWAFLLEHLRIRSSACQGHKPGPNEQEPSSLGTEGCKVRGQGYMLRQKGFSRIFIFSRVMVRYSKKKNFFVNLPLNVFFIKGGDYLTSLRILTFIYSI